MLGKVAIATLLLGAAGTTTTTTTTTTTAAAAAATAAATTPDADFRGLCGRVQEDEEPVRKQEGEAGTQANSGLCSQRAW